MRDQLNPPAIMAGAAVCLTIAVPAAVIQEVLADDDAGTNQSNWVFLALLAIIVAYLAGGAVAGHRSPAAPFLNGAAATVVAFAFVQTVGLFVRLIQGEGINIVALVFNSLLAATIGIAGAGFGARRRALRQTGSS